MYKKPIIVFEGIEGSGKSLHINNVAVYLKKKGRKYIKIRFKKKVKIKLKSYDIFCYLKKRTAVKQQKLRILPN